MEIRQIKELMTAMERTGTKRLSIQKKEFQLELEREDHFLQKSPFFQEEEDHYLKGESALRKASMAVAKKGSEIVAGKVEEGESGDEISGVFVTSPMVGTFYLAPSPEEPYFVKVGDKIDKETVVCIIEAMKVMNEVKAQVNGVVTEILVENGHPVEFGTKLFRVT